MASIRPGGTNSLKKIDFSTPPRTCTSPGGTCTRSDFLCAIVARATPRPLPRPNGMRGRPFAALRANGPVMAALAADFSPARVAIRYGARTPRRLCALSRPCAPSGAERTGRNRHLRTSHVPNLAFSPNGDEKKWHFQIGPAPAAQESSGAHPPRSRYATDHKWRPRRLQEPPDSVLESSRAPLEGLHLHFNPALRFTDFKRTYRMWL